MCRYDFDKAFGIVQYLILVGSVPWSMGRPIWRALTSGVNFQLNTSIKGL